MAVRGWNCDRCGVFTQALFFWPGPANPTHNVCRRCYALLWTASQYQVTTSGSTADYVLPQTQSDNTSGCPYKVPPAKESSPSARTAKHHLIPAGCEYRFLFELWRLHRGLTEPLRNRVVAPEPALEGVVTQ